MDTVFYMIAMAPLIYIIIKQDRLNEPTFVKLWVLLGIVMICLGSMYLSLSNTQNKWLVYIGSQMTLTFIINYRITVFIFSLFTNRIPEISKSPRKAIDIIPTTVVILGTILAPLFLDIYFLKRMIS